MNDLQSLKTKLKIAAKEEKYKESPSENFRTEK